MSKEIKRRREKEQKSMKLIKEKQRISMKQRVGSLRKKINKIDKPLGRVTRKRQITNIGMKHGISLKTSQISKR